MKIRKGGCANSWHSVCQQLWSSEEGPQDVQARASGSRNVENATLEASMPGPVDGMGNPVRLTRRSLFGEHFIEDVGKIARALEIVHLATIVTSS